MGSTYRYVYFTHILGFVILPINLQVVKYDVKGHYDAHHDSVDLYPEQPCCDTTMFKDCRICRLVAYRVYNYPNGFDRIPVTEGNSIDTH